MSTSQDGTQHASKSAAAIDRARAQGRAALIGYLPAGFPTVDASIELIAAMISGGAAACRSPP